MYRYYKFASEGAGPAKVFQGSLRTVGSTFRNWSLSVFNDGASMDNLDTFRRLAYSRYDGLQKLWV